MTAQPSITCRLCGFTSYNPNDISNLYCGRCHSFHQLPFMPMTPTPRANIPHCASIALAAQELKDAAALDPVGEHGLMERAMRAIANEGADKTPRRSFEFEGVEMTAALTLIQSPTERRIWLLSIYDAKGGREVDKSLGLDIAQAIIGDKAHEIADDPDLFVLPMRRYFALNLNQS